MDNNELVNCFLSELIAENFTSTKRIYLKREITTRLVRDKNFAHMTCGTLRKCLQGKGDQPVGKGKQCFDFILLILFCEGANEHRSKGSQQCADADFEFVWAQPVGNKTQ